MSNCDYPFGFWVFVPIGPDPSEYGSFSSGGSVSISKELGGYFNLPNVPSTSVSWMVATAKKNIGDSFNKNAKYMGNPNESINVGQAVKDFWTAIVGLGGNFEILNSGTFPSGFVPADNKLYLLGAVTSVSSDRRVKQRYIAQIYKPTDEIIAKVCANKGTNSQLDFCGKYSKIPKECDTFMNVYCGSSGAGRYSTLCGCFDPYIKKNLGDSSVTQLQDKGYNVPNSCFPSCDPQSAFVPSTLQNCALNLCIANIDNSGKLNVGKAINIDQQCGYKQGDCPTEQKCPGQECPDCPSRQSCPNCPAEQECSPDGNEDSCPDSKKWKTATIVAGGIAATLLLLLLLLLGFYAMF